MSFDAYISLMVSVIVVSIITIFTDLYFSKTEVIDNVNNTNGRRKRNKIAVNYNRKKNHCYIIIIFWVIVSVILTLIFIRSKINEYNRIDDQANYELNNRNYVDAAKLFHEASLSAYNKKSKFDAIYSEASCYLILSVLTEKDIYISNSFRLLNEISDPKYKEFEFYKDIPIDICLVCSTLNKNSYNINISEIVTKLENTYKFSDLDNISDTDVDFMNKVAMTIGLYYKNEANRAKKEFDLNSYKIYANKAIFYYNAVCQLMGRANIRHYNQVNIPILYTQISDFMVNNALFMFDNNVGYTKFDETIKFCTDAIKCFDITNDSNNDEIFRAYIELTVDLGKAYVFSGVFIEKENLINAYNTLHPLLKVKSENIEIEFSLLDVGLYIIQTKKCTDEDIKIILDRYENVIKKLYNNNNISDYIRIMNSACAACDGIILNYENSERAKSLKDKYSKELDNLSSFLNGTEY